MKFKINDREWEIKEVEQEEFWKDDKKLDEMNNDSYFFGRTKYDRQEIWICKTISKEQKRTTLYHELMHCYRGMYLGFIEMNNCDEEFWCDLSANSHDIIHKIVEDYFKEVK